jgi:type I restriction enzyme, S subunit
MNKNNIVDIIDVDQRHYKIIKEIFAKFLPYKKVLAYGSRVKWNASETSDLDLAVFNATEKEIYAVKEAFDESNIPFIIQILNWETIPQDFKENIEKKYHILQKEDDWGIFKLGDVGEIITGKTPSKNNPEDWGDFIPFVTPTDYGNYQKIAYSSIRNLSQEGYDKLIKKVLPKYSVMVTCIGSDMGKVAMNNLPVITNQQINSIVSNDKAESNFLYYKLVGLYDTLRSFGSDGTAVPILNKNDFSNIEILLPPLLEQKAIAEILSSLDDKIDLLHRQNKTLENLAETLFRHYFIDNAKDDWDSEEMGKYVNVVDNRGKTPPNQKEITPYPVIEVNALGKGDRLVDYSLIRKYVDKNTFENWFRAKPKKYDILISTVGSIGEFSMFILEVGNIAQNVIALQAKEISPFYLYQVLKYKHEEVMNLDIGGVQPSIKVPHLLSIIIPIPEIEIQKEFDIQITEFVKKMETNYLQIQTLEKLRDTLVPKLISGEIRVNYKENE